MWFRNLKTDGCVSCHQIGNKATRTIPAALGHFNTGAEAWERRLQSGQASGPMMGAIGRFDTQRALTRSAIGPTASRRANCPKNTPPRPPAGSATSSSRSGTGTRRPLICMTRSRRDRNNPRVQREWPHLRFDRSELGHGSVARSCRQHGRSDQDRIPRREDADRRRKIRSTAHPRIGATSRSGTRTPTRITR